MTRLYIDSASPREWEQALASALVSRATCNPLLMDAAGWPVRLDSVEALWREAERQGLEELHLQAWPNEQGDWEPVARHLAALSPRVVVKLPAVPAAMRAARALCRDGVRVLVTAISNPLHGLWAAEVGASFVAPYVGRLQEAGRDAHALVDGLVGLQARGGPVVLAASVRHLDMLGQLLRQGVGAVTLRMGLLQAAMDDAEALKAVAQFEAVRQSRT